ncbi:MAG: 2-oxoacid:acceptor oxidoreductase subunit alpha [Armatimonadota bacterium]|nr:MAG: 2-oxoacid:acceptor oxidoreductase subunit alpha [Armatimonadota bacterium]
MDINIRIAGAAGQGVETSGDLLVEAFAKLGVHVFSTQTYMSRIRGGLNWYDVRIADTELFSGREKADLLLALTEEAREWLRAEVSEGGVTLFNGSGQSDVIGIEFAGVAKEVGGTAIMANTVAAGAVFGLLGYDVGMLESELGARFEKKGAAVVEGNVACARRGAELAEAHAGKLQAPKGGTAPSGICSGNEAVGLGAATAGVKLVTSYPMTPSTGVITFLAGVADKYGIVVEQAEDEIAAINMVCGATYAGAPAMTTTSGGGFALMVEGLSLAGMLELPVFIFLGQRPGPATGLPTRTAQQDLLFALHAGHGEFPRAIFAPGTPQQCYDLTRHALEIAHKYQSPVILMSDQFLADVRKNCTGLDTSYRPIERHLLEDPPGDYLRYAVTESGVSPRAIPGGKAFVVVDSDEHAEDGHITDDLSARMRLQDKRMRKLEGLIADALPPEWYGPEEAEQVLIAWGSTYGPCREAVDRLNGDGGSAAMAHFPQVWPLDVERVRQLLGRGKRLLSVECNQAGQFASVLRQVGAVAQCELMTRYDGMPFTGEEIARRVKS